jgi:hypothetical protein
MPIKITNLDNSSISFDLTDEDLNSIKIEDVDGAVLSTIKGGGFAIRNHALNVDGGFAIRNHALNLDGGFAIRNHTLNV